MLNIKSQTLTALAAIMLLSSASWSVAKEAKGFSSAKITLSEAIRAAEKHTGGKAYEASFDDDNFKPTYEVDIIKNGKSFDVEVDGLNGKIIRSRPDDDD